LPLVPGRDADAGSSSAGRVSRRTLLLGALGLTVGIGGAGALAVEEGALPGRSTMHRMLGLDGPAGTIPDVSPIPTKSGAFLSAARRGARTGWTICTPPTTRRLRPLIVLHGRGGDHRSAFDDHLGLDRFLARAIHQGTPPFAIASVDGGNHSYWHRRADGDDAGRMLVDEFLPLLAAHGLDTSRIALLGWSMGGYGALLLGGRLRGRVSAVVAESPAIWHRSADTASGAFDDPGDFARNTVFGRQRELEGIAVRIDCGTDDGFYPAARDYARSLTPPPAGGFERGGHDMDYWRRMAPAQLAFVGQHLAGG
jgi:enterochelin esterase-like enzyme